MLIIYCFRYGVSHDCLNAANEVTQKNMVNIDWYLTKTTHNQAQNAIKRGQVYASKIHIKVSHVFLIYIYISFISQNLKTHCYTYIYMSFKLQYYKDYTKIRNTSMIRYKSHCNTEHILDKCIRLLAVCLKNIYYTSYVKRRPNTWYQLIKACKKRLGKSNDRAHIHLLCPKSTYNKYTTVIRLTYCN